MRRILGRQLGATVLHGVAYFPVLLLTFTGAELVFGAVNAIPRHVRDAPWLAWLGWAINVIPPLLAGAVAFGGLVYALRSYLPRGDGLRGHVVRVAPLYLAALLNAWWILAGRGTADFGLWAQIPLWAGLVAVGGVLADLVVSRGRTAAAAV